MLLREKKTSCHFFSNCSEEAYRSLPSTPGQTAQSRTEGTSKQYFFQHSAGQRVNCSNQECRKQGKTFVMDVWLLVLIIKCISLGTSFSWALLEAQTLALSPPNKWISKVTVEVIKTFTVAICKQLTLPWYS